MNALLFAENKGDELPQKAFLEVHNLPQNKGEVSVFPNRANLIQLLSRLEFTRGVLRLLRHARYKPSERPRAAVAHSATYLVDPRITEVVKFPQCWRTIFEQLSIAVATLVREQINVLFLDCNITPLEEMFSDRMPSKVRRHVVEVLRGHLNGLLADIRDENLISEITRRISLISKPVVITDHLRRQALKGTVKDVFLVGGSQISDPSMSKYHDGLISIDDLITVHTLDPEQVRYTKLAMYFAEKTEADKGHTKVRQLYETVKRMLPTIEQADRPLIVIASTSLCQTYHDNGNQIIPENAVADLAEALGISVNEMEAERTKINAIPVLNTTEVYAQTAAEVLASNATLYGYSYT